MQPRKAKVFCIGLGRTGTTTFGHVMRQFGYVHKTGPVQLGLIYAELGDLDPFYPLVEQNDSFADFPYPRIYRDCAERYPDSQFVLTLRRSPETWLKSLATHNLRKGPTDANFLAYGCYVSTGHEARLIQVYNDHVASVRQYFAGSGRLLELDWEQPDALERLAAFIGHDGPAGSVPMVNSAASKDPRQMIDRLIADRRIGAAIALARSQPKGEELVDYIRGREGDWGVKGLPNRPRKGLLERMLPGKARR